jgi:hypothetical protein
MRLVTVIALIVATALPSAAEAVPLDLGTPQLTAPLNPTNFWSPDASPQSNRVGAGVATYFAEILASTPAVLGAFLGLLITDEPDCSTNNCSLGSRLGAIGVLSTVPTLLTSAVAYWIARDFHGRPSYWRIYVSSAIVRTAVAVTFLVSGRGLWAIGQIALAPTLGVLTEIIVAQFDFDGPPDVPVKVAAPWIEPHGTPEHLPRTTLLPLLAFAF